MTSDTRIREPHGKRPARAVLAHVKQYALPSGDPGMRGRIIFALLCLGLAKLAAVVAPLIYGVVVDHVSGPVTSMTTLLYLIGGYGLVRVGQDLFEELKQVIFTRVVQKAMRKAALTVFRHLHSLSFGFHLSRSMGAVIKIVDRGVKGLDYLLSLTMLQILPAAMELVLVSFVLWKKFNIQYMLVTVGTVAVYVAYTFLLTEWRMKLRIRLNRADEDAAKQAVDSLINFETVKYFNAEGHEAEAYDGMLRKSEDASVRWRTSVSLVNFGQGLIIALGLAAVMYLAGRDIHSGTLSVGGFVAINTLLLQLYLPLGFVGFVYREIRSSLADTERMVDLLEEEPEVQDRPGAVPLRLSKGEIEVDNVGFSIGERRILTGLSFRVPAGHKVAIVGRSGTGKTTLVRLLLRLYDVDSGAIYIDGQDLRSVTQASLRSVIGVVPQDTVLFNDTIGHNISYGRIDAGQGEIEKASRMAALDGFIGKLPGSYDTVVGERGLKLSGGEKQRIAIARAMIKSPAILLLDEATSSLDSTTEQDIAQAIHRVSRSRTTVVIAHRLSTVADADNIIVLDDGKIVEEGNHNALIAMNGIYADMWRQQQAANGDGQVS